ncbi:MAG: Lrp/AsnC family transcriptional regulator [Chloroflexi bacterium]|nr:Lrp/AsnC family transcriptional regulator [Chloroflexota bacterium]
MSNTHPSPEGEKAQFITLEDGRRFKIDAIDRYIIAALKHDGRMPFAKIAEELGVSPGMIRQRYHRLVENGVMQVVAVTNPVLMGFHTVALIGIKAEGRHLREIAQRIASFDEVIYLVLTTGTYDLLVEVVCRDNAHLLEFLTERLHTVEGVRDTETFVYLDIVKEIYTWGP